MGGVISNNSMMMLLRQEARGLTCSCLISESGFATLVKPVSIPTIMSVERGVQLGRANYLVIGEIILSRPVVFNLLPRSR